jgi:putative SOS response-associated peptidase YedK
MCRLYHLGRSPRELARQFCLTLDVPLPNFAPSWRIATTDPAPVLRRHPQTGERRLDVLRWGLVPHWTKEPARALKPVNARSDTVSTSAMFRGAYRERRCLVPVDGWYEWQKHPDGRKQAHAFAARRAAAGLCRHLGERALAQSGGPPQLRNRHHRSPAPRLALRQADWPLWLGESDGDPATLLRPAPDGMLGIWPIPSPLGKGRPNGPELLESASALER